MALSVGLSEKLLAHLLFEHWPVSTPGLRDHMLDLKILILKRDGLGLVRFVLKVTVYLAEQQSKPVLIDPARAVMPSINECKLEVVRCRPLVPMRLVAQGRDHGETRMRRC